MMKTIRNFLEIVQESEKISKAPGSGPLYVTASLPTNTKAIMHVRCEPEQLKDLIELAQKHALKQGEDYYNITVQNTQTYEVTSGRSDNTKWRVVSVGN